MHTPPSAPARVPVSRYLILGILCAALSACGGGSGGGMSPGPMEPSMPLDLAGQLEDESTAAVIVARAATNSPRPGSVTQSSNGNGATLDSVSVVQSEKDDDTIRFVVTNQSGAQWSIDSDTAEIQERRSDEDGAEYALRRADTEGTLYVRVGHENLHSLREGREHLFDENVYVNLGYWLYYPANTNDPAPIIGVFTDSNDLFTQANLAPLTGSAEYKGGGIGVGYLNRRSHTAVVDYEFDVTLMASFGDASELGTISGTLNVSENSLEPGNGGDPEAELRFEPASIGSSDSGFFAGDVTYVGNDNEVTSSHGKWGGQFFGNPGVGSTNPSPGGVHGTFGAQLTYGEDGTSSFIGTFVTLRR